MNFEVNMLILIFLVLISYYLIKVTDTNQYHQLKISIEQLRITFSDKSDIIEQFKDYFGQYFYKKQSPSLPQQSEKIKEYNFIIRHYEDFFVGYLKNLSVQMKCKSNEILYANFSKNNFESYTGGGQLFKVSYDSNFNPNYEIYDGHFQNGLKHGYGKIFGQKSDNIAYEGQWIDNELINIQKNEQNHIQQYQKEDQQSHIRVIIKDGDKIINQNLKQRKNKRKGESWIKFNQLISDNDITILKNRSRWFTSSIIDSFALYLNIQIEEQYFKIDPNIRKLAIRQTFIPSYIFTQMSKNIKDVNQQIFQNHFLEYKKIDYQIQKIYDRMNFIINSNNHWFLIQLNLKNYEMIVMDSIKNKVQSYNFAKEILNSIFGNQIQKITISDKCIQQNNLYDCGPFTCLNMLQISEIQLKLETPSQMRDFLLEQLKQN